MNVMIEKYLVQIYKSYVSRSCEITRKKLQLSEYQIENES